MTQIAEPLIANLRAWQDEQNPLVRAFTESLVLTMSQALTQMQSVIDEQAAIIAEQAALIAQLQAEREEMKAEHAVACQVLKDRIDQLERQVYGRKSERSTKTPDARRVARKRRNQELSEEEKRARRAAALQKRQAELEKLRTVTVFLPVQGKDGEPPPEGRPLPSLDSVIYEWRAGELVRILIQREQLVVPDGPIVTAPPPPQVVEGGIYGPALHAKVAMDKCLNAMPLHRQERAFRRIGAPLPVSVLCSMFHRCGRGVEAIYKALVAHVGTAEHVSADETPQPVLDKDKVRTAWMWVFATDDAIVYVHSPSRGGKVPEKVLGRSKGTLTVDGHTGYNLVTGEDGRARGGCWSHGRRGLYEARGYAEELVGGMIDQIGELFYIEHLAIEQQIVGTDAHLALREARSAPVVAALFAALETHVGTFDDRSSIAKAMRYLLNQREPLSLFLTNAHVPIHNNLSERALRIVALLRKNALFVGHDEGGENLAMLLSVAATCQLHGVDPEPWLADVLIRIGDRDSTVEELLPWEWKTGRGTTTRSLLSTA